MVDRIRVLLAKPTQDCHDRGVRHLARVLRDAGFDVIFVNFLLADEVVSVAVEEDVDVIGISSSSGGHVAVFEDLMGGLRRAGRHGDILVLAGGVIPGNDASTLEELGVSRIFGPGSNPQQVAEHIESWARRQDRWSTTSTTR